jgi:hypothetical protein
LISVAKQVCKDMHQDPPCPFLTSDLLDVIIKILLANLQDKIWSIIIMVQNFLYVKKKWTKKWSMICPVGGKAPKMLETEVETIMSHVKGLIRIVRMDIHIQLCKERTAGFRKYGLLLPWRTFIGILCM